MHVNNNNNQLSGMEHAAEAYTEHIGLTDDDEDISEVDSDAESEKVSEKQGKKPRIGRKRSTSVSLLNRDIKLKDLAYKQAENQANRQKQVYQDKLSRQLKDQYQQQMQDILRTQSKMQLKDQVVLSENVLTNATEESLSEYTKSDPLEDPSVMGTIGQDDLTVAEQEKLEARTGKKSQYRQKSGEQVLKRAAQKEIQQTFQKYLQHVAEDIIKQDPQKKESVKKARSQLLSKGVSPRKIKQAEVRIQQMIHSDLKKELRRQFSKVAVTYTPQTLTGELLGHFKAFKAMIKMAEDVGVFGSDYRAESQVKEDVRQEFRDFLYSELDDKLTETKLQSNDPKKLVKVFDEMNNLASFVKFNPEEYMNQFHIKMDDLGLRHFVSPDKKGALDSEESDQGRQRQSQEFALEEDDEESVGSIEQKLRRLYIRQYMVEGIIPTIKLKFNINRCERQMSRLGQEKMIHTLRKESQNLARLRLTFMLRESLEDRATLPKLKGDSYKLIKKRIKLALKGLKSLGVPMSRSDRNEMRDQANRSIFTLIKEDYIKMEVHLETNPNNRPLKYKRDQLLQTLNRLKLETKINETVKPKLMQDMSFLSDINIIEAA